MPTMTTVPAREPLPMVATGPCWVCGGAALDRVWSDPFDLSAFPRFGAHAHGGHAPSWVVRCRACGFGQPEGLPAVGDFFETLYAIDWTAESLDREFDSGYKDRIFAAVLAGLGRRLAPGVPRTLLDVGAHVGRFVHLALRDGWEAEGAELNPLTASYAARRTGAPIHRERAEDLAARGVRFGAVTLTDVLEHIPRPVELLAGLRELLHPGGVVAVKVPHGPAQRLKEGIRRALLRRGDAGVMVRFVHVTHFPVGSLRRALARAGFDRVEVVAAVPDFVPAGRGDWGRWPLGPSLLRLATYGAARAVPGGVHTPLALNLQA